MSFKDIRSLDYRITFSELDVYKQMKWRARRRHKKNNKKIEKNPELKKILDKLVDDIDKFIMEELRFD